MLLTAFGMTGTVQKDVDRFRTEHSAEIPGVVWKLQSGSVSQGPLFQDEQPLLSAADRLLLTGWVDLASLPETATDGGDGLAILQRMLDEHGAKAVTALRGDFVLAHIAPGRQALRLYRAVNALIPLFWRCHRNTFAWSTDPLLLLEDGRPRLSDVDSELLPMLIAEKGLPHDRSWFVDVRRISTGQCLTLRPRAEPVVDTFDEFHPATSVPATINEAADGLRERLSQACSRMLIKNRASVLLLSGGIDSAAVAHEMGNRGGGVGLHFTMDGFPGHHADRKAAEATARACGLTWVPYEMSKHTRAGGDYVRVAETGALPHTHVPRPGADVAVEQAEATGSTFVLSGLLADQILAHDRQRGLLEVGRASMLNPAVAGEPIWQVLANAAGTSFSGASGGAYGTLRYLWRLASGDPTTALPDRDTIVHPLGFTEQAGERVTQALRAAAERAHHGLHASIRRNKWSRRALPRGITSLFMLTESFNTANLQAIWLNLCLPKRRVLATPYADRDLIEYALALPTRHRLGFGYGMTIDKFALRIAYADRVGVARAGLRSQQARIDAVPATFVNQNFDTCRRLLHHDSLLCQLGVISRDFVSDLHPGRVHRNGEEIARLCVIEQWLEGLA